MIQKTFYYKVLSVNSYIKPGKSRSLNNSKGFKSSYKRVFVKVML